MSPLKKYDSWDPNQARRNVGPDLDPNCFHPDGILKQEGHSGPESLTCTMCTSHISLCDPRGGPVLVPGALFEQT